MVPFGEFGVGQQSVVAAEEAGFDSGPHTIAGVENAGGVVGILPVALRCG
jgi:hypothetical protein